MNTYGTPTGNCRVDAAAGENAVVVIRNQCALAPKPWRAWQRPDAELRRRGRLPLSSVSGNEVASDGRLGVATTVSLLPRRRSAKGRERTPCAQRANGARSVSPARADYYLPHHRPAAPPALSCPYGRHPTRERVAARTAEAAAPGPARPGLREGGFRAACRLRWNPAVPCFPHVEHHFSPGGEEQPGCSRITTPKPSRK